MVRRVVILALVMFGGVAVILTPPSAWACSCAAASAEAHFASSDAVFTGVLVDRRAPGGTGSSMGHVELVFEVDRVYRGEVAEQQPIVSVVSGASCGLEITGRGPFLVFASRGEMGAGPDELGASLCGGTGELGTAALPTSFGPGATPTAIDDPPDDRPAGGEQAEAVDVDVTAPDGNSTMTAWVVGGTAGAALVGAGALIAVRRARSRSLLEG